MTAQATWHGNPRAVANFLNESDKKTLKQVSSGCSQLTFEQSVLFKMREIMQPARPARAPKPPKRRR